MDTKIHFFGEDSKLHKWGIDPLEIILSTYALSPKVVAMAFFSSAIIVKILGLGFVVGCNVTWEGDLSPCHLTFGGLDAVEQPMVDWPYGEV